jgi:hypothetical protein
MRVCVPYVPLRTVRTGTSVRACGHAHHGRCAVETECADMCGGGAAVQVRLCQQGPYKILLMCRALLLRFRPCEPLVHILLTPAASRHGLMA